MLVPTRREGETITLAPLKDIEPNMVVGELFAGGPISNEILESGFQTKLGIDAPHDLKVLRLVLSSEHNY